MRIPSSSVVAYGRAREAPGERALMQRLTQGVSCRGRPTPQSSLARASERQSSAEDPPAEDDRCRRHRRCRQQDQADLADAEHRDRRATAAFLWRTGGTAAAIPEHDRRRADCRIVRKASKQPEDGSWMPGGGQPEVPDITAADQRRVWAPQACHHGCCRQSKRQRNAAAASREPAGQQAARAPALQLAPGAARPRMRDLPGGRASRGPAGRSRRLRRGARLLSPRFRAGRAVRTARFRDRSGRSRPRRGHGQQGEQAGRPEREQRAADDRDQKPARP